MAVSPKALAQKLSHLFDAGGAEALCTHYTFPLPVQLHDGYSLIQSPKDLALAFDSLRARQTAAGLLNPSVEIAATELPRQGRFRIWLDWTLTDSKTRLPVSERVVYYCSQIGRNIGIDMIQCMGVLNENAISLGDQTQTA